MRIDERVAHAGLRREMYDLAETGHRVADCAGGPQVVHLAAQAGVRHSLVDPHAYADANLIASSTCWRAAGRRKSRHLLYASSSSVYGANTQMPFSTAQNVDHPLSPLWRDQESQ